MYLYSFDEHRFAALSNAQGGCACRHPHSNNNINPCCYPPRHLPVYIYEKRVPVAVPVRERVPIPYPVEVPRPQVVERGNTFVWFLRFFFLQNCMLKIIINFSFFLFFFFYSRHDIISVIQPVAAAPPPVLTTYQQAGFMGGYEWKKK